MQCPECHTEDYEIDKPCPQCGFWMRGNGLGEDSLTSEELQKAWTELAHLEILFEMVEVWRKEGYFSQEMASQDPVRAQRARADILRKKLEKYPPPKSPQSEADRLRLMNFLMDNVDLIASRGWFKSKKEIEKVVSPILSMMMDAISGDDVNSDDETE